MTKLIRARDLHERRYKQDAGYRTAYDASEEEFALVQTIIDARSRAGLTQAELARRMNTSQAVIARLESGGTLPSTRTLQRFAKATGHRLVISFEPEGKGQGEEAA